jgi:hypothetical protein
MDGGHTGFRVGAGGGCNRLEVNMSGNSRLRQVTLWFLAFGLLCVWDIERRSPSF